MSPRSQSGDEDRTKLDSSEGPVNRKQDADGSTPTNEDAVPQTMNQRPSTPWPPTRPQGDDIQAFLGNPNEEIQSRAPESQQVYLDTYQSQANSLSASFRGSSHDAQEVARQSIERARDTGNHTNSQGRAGNTAIAPQAQQNWPTTQPLISNAPMWPGQEGWSAPQFQFSAPEYRPAPQELRGMPGPHPNLLIIQNQPVNQYSAVPHFQSAVPPGRQAEQKQRRLPRPQSMLSTAQDQSVNQNSGFSHFQSTVPQKRPADQEQRRSPRPHPYLPTIQNQPVNRNSSVSHSQSDIPQRRPADEERRRLPRAHSLSSNVQNQRGYQNSAVRHLQSAVPQKRPADQEERRPQGTRSLLPTAPTPPKKPRSKPSRDPFSDSEDSTEVLESSMRERREQDSTPNPIPKRMVETAPSGEQKLSLDRPKIGPRPVGYRPAHAPQRRSNARSTSSMAEPPSESPRRSSHENRQERVSGVSVPVDRNNTAAKKPAANVDSTGDKPLGASDNEFGLPRTW